MYFLAFVSTLLAYASAIETKHQLVQRLLHPDNYDKTLDPIGNGVDLPKLGLAVETFFVDYVDESRQVIGVSMQLSVFYNDSRLVWDSGENGIRAFRVDSNRLWRPPLMMMARAYQRDDYTTPVNARVRSNGEVATLMVFTDELAFHFDNYKFPLDSHDLTFYLHSEALENYNFGLEPYCRNMVETNGDVLGLNMSECSEFINALYYYDDLQLIREPAGWTVGTRTIGSIVGTRQFLFEFDRWTTKLPFRLRRRALTSVMVWLATPFCITTVAMGALFYLW